MNDNTKDVLTPNPLPVVKETSVSAPVTKVELVEVIIVKRHWKKKSILVQLDGVYGALPLDFPVGAKDKVVKVPVSDWNIKYKF